MLRRQQPRSAPPEAIPRVNRPPAATSEVASDPRVLSATCPVHRQWLPAMVATASQVRSYPEVFPCVLGSPPDQARAETSVCGACATIVPGLSGTGAPSLYSRPAAIS